MLVILFDEPDNDPRGGVVAEFDSPNSSFPPKSVNGVHARLPAIGFDETGVQYNAPMVGADDGFHDDAVVRGVSNTLLVAEDPKTYEVPSIRRFPRSIGSRRSSQASSRCSWSVIDPSQTIRVNLPSNGSLQGLHMVWTGSFGLSATISAVGREFEATRSRNDFLSGI